MESLEQHLEQCKQLHGHMCAGQLLGARMAMLGCQLIGIDDPRGVDRRKLIVWVEIDRCMADAVSAVTGARLGKRSLKFVDYGKVAATFLNTETSSAVRVVALESSRLLADQRFPEIAERRERQFRFYSEASNEDLFKVESVFLQLKNTDRPGSPLSRVMCAMCGEGINDGREVIASDGSKQCKACAQGSYYSSIN